MEGNPDGTSCSVEDEKDDESESEDEDSDSEEEEEKKDEVALPNMKILDEVINYLV